MRLSLLVLLFTGLLFPFNSTATTIIPFANLADLYAASDAVVFVQAGPLYQTSTEASTYNDCNFKVLTTLKGAMATNDVFPLRQYSRADQWGHLDIAGDFVPTQGHSYLVFLNKNNSAWRLMMLSYYVFEQIEADGIQYLVPVEQSLRMAVLPRPDGTMAEPITTYRKDALLQLLQQQGKGSYIPWDDRGAQATSPLLDQVSDRVLPTGCDFDLGNGMSRWQNTTINVYYDVTNAPADASARYSSTIATLNSEYTGLNLIAAGTTDFTPNCTGGSASGGNFTSFVNSLNGTQTTLIMFEDPCNEIPPLVGCAGTLGIGGGYAFNTTHTYKGQSWFNATWGYVIINNGARACETNDVDYERLLSHELTHTMQMDHLDAITYSGNNMNPLCCNPINTKDRECMNYVYDIALPVDLISFDARAAKEEVVLKWSTAQEFNNDYFLVERSNDGRKFERLATVEASNVSHSSNYTLTDEQPFAGVNYYRLSQADRDGTTKELGLRVVTYQGEASGYTLVPNPVPGNSIILTSRAKESAVGSLQIFSSTGTLVYELANSPQLENKRLEVPIGDLPAGIYWLKINESGRSESLKFVRL